MAEMLATRGNSRESAAGRASGRFPAVSASCEHFRHLASFLASTPSGRALAEEGADALFGVLGGEDGGEAGLLGLDALVEVTGGRDLLDLLDGDGRLARQL